MRLTKLVPLHVGVLMVFITLYLHYILIRNKISWVVILLMTLSPFLRGLEGGVVLELVISILVWVLPQFI